MTGLKVSHYRVLEKLGEGGMGVVYKAEDLRLGRLVALKFLSEGSSTTAVALERFRREARTASALDHPNICTIYEVDDVDGQPFIAMQLLEGTTLQQSISARRLSLTEILAWAMQITGALQAAHSRGIVHRDLKPANVFITTRGEVKILDFGLAKLAPRATVSPARVGPGLDATQDASTDPAGLTGTGMIAGTFAYMSPEQASGQAVDGRSDLFAFGAVLYEMATGRQAFPGSTAAVIFHAILGRPPLPVRDIAPALPAAIERIIGKALEKEPEARYQSAAEIQVELKLLYSSVIQKANAVTENVPAITRGRGSTGRRPLIASVMFLAIAGAGASTWMLTHRTRQNAAVQFPTLKNLAVLPVSVPSNSAQLSSLGSGLTDGITGRMVQLTADHDLQVAPAHQLRDKGIVTTDDARVRLGATVGLAVSLQQSGGLVRAEWTLWDARRQRVIKAGSALAPENDLFVIEDRVAAGAAAALGIILQPDDLRTLSFHGTAIPEAYRYYLEGRTYLDEPSKPGALDSAGTFFRHALSLDPSYGSAEASLGTTLLRKYTDTKRLLDLTQARQHCSKAVQLGNAGAEGHLCLGILANATGEYLEALQQFRLAVELAPTDDQGFISLAAAYQQLNRPAEAESTYTQAIQIRPQYWRPYSFLGAFYLSRAEYEKAGQMFLKAAELAPDSFQNWNNLGATYLYEGNQQQAVEPLKRSLALYPTGDAYANLGTAYFQLRRFNDAASSYRQALKIDASDYEIWGNLGDALFFGGGKDAALAAYRKAVTLANQQLQVNSKDPQMLAHLGGYHAMLGQKREALDLIHRALQLTGASKDILFSTALIYNQLGDEEVALEWLQKAVASGYSRAVIKAAPALNNLHQNAQYRRLLE